MRKILLTLVLSIFISSCTIEELKNMQETETNSGSELKQVEENIDYIQEGSIEGLKAKIDYIESEMKDDEIVISEVEMYLSNIIEQNINRKAEKESNIKICEKHDNDSSKNSCIYQVTIMQANNAKTDEACSENLVNDFDINSCKNSINANLARELIDVNLCEKIESEDDYLVVNCKNEVYTKEAIEKNDRRVCNKISDEGMVEMCKSEIEILRELENNK